MPINSLASKNKNVFADLDLFIECCEVRYIYERNATREQWLVLAEQFQLAKGLGKISYMSEYCMKKAGMAI